MFASSKLTMLVFSSCLCKRPVERHWLLDNLKVDVRNVTNSIIFATKSSNQNFIVFCNIGMKAVSFLPSLISRPSHFLMAEFSCLFLPPTFSSKILFECNMPPRGLAFRAVPRCAFLYCLSHYLVLFVAVELLVVRRP